MKVKWNNCFFCLNELPKETSADVEVNLKVNRLKSILNFIIGGESQKLDITEKVSDLWTNRDSTYSVDLCDNCNSQVNRFITLKVDLEIIQIQICEIIKQVRKVIIQNSKFYGGDEDNLGKLGLHIFEDWLKSQSKNNQNNFVGEEVKTGRKILDTLYAFQGAVFENWQSTPNKIPCVYLENLKTPTVVRAHSRRYRPGPKSKKPVDLIHTNTSQSEDQIVVKVEPEFPSTSFDIDDTFENNDNNDDLDNQEEPTSVNLDLVKPEVLLGNHVAKIPRKKGVLQKRISPRKTRKTAKLSKRKPPSKKSVKQVVKSKKPNTSSKKSIPSHQTPRQKKRRSCDICPFTTKSIHKFEFHLRKHELPQKSFTCESCRLSFSNKQYHDFHLACHQGQYKLRCDLCSKNVDLILLTQHMKDHQQNGDATLKLFPCPNCSYCSSLREKYLEHLREHDKSGQFFCDICGSEVADRAKLLSHLYSDHDAIQKLTCGFEGCKMEYFDNIRLWNHEQTHKRQWICEFCGKACTSPGSLKVHERNHTGERPFPCDQCSENFKTKLDLNRHLINKHNAEKYQCQFCDKQYRDPSSLQNHMRVHDGSAFPCEVCGQAFVSKYQLRRHMNAHSTERNFVCEECGKAFRTKDTLASHIKTHTGALRFKCSYCSKAFKINQHLIAHLRTHTGERPFVCDICGSSFTQAGPLNNHKKKHSSELLSKSLGDFELIPPKRDIKL